MSERGTMPVGDLTGISLDYTRADESPGICSTTAGGFVPLFGWLDGDAWLFAGAADGETHRMITVDLPDGRTVLILVYAVEPDQLADHLDDAMEVVGESRVRRRRLEVAAPGLLDLDRLEQRLEVADAEAAGAVALDDLEEERRPILHRAGEDLEEIALLVAIGLDAELLERARSGRRRRRPGRAATRSRRAACRGTRRRARAGRATVPTMSSVRSAMCWVPASR